MKKTRRFAAMVAAMALAATMMAPAAMMTASAADITITSNGNATAKDHTFAAYQIFTGTINAGGTGFTGTASTVGWGSAVSGKEAEFITALKGTTFVTAAANTAISGLTATSSAYEVSQAIGALQGANDAAALADMIAAFITDQSISTTAGTGAAAASGNDYEITGLADGYYFVKDTTNPLAAGDAYSKYVLQVAGSASIAIKTDAPTLVKKIWDNDTTAAPTIGTSAPTFYDDLTTHGWNDVADNQIGDTVYYCIETSVPDMSAYDTYKYIIRDTLSAGLTMGTVTNIVYVPAAAGSDATVLHDTTATPPVATATGITITTGDDASTTGATETFYISMADLKTVLSGKSITPAAGDKIYTYYTATLNEDAKTSASENATQGNPNEAWLSYSNNPNQSGSGGTHPTGDTPHDTVYDWTYTFDANKVDEKGDPLAGATFELRSGGTAMSLVSMTFTEYKALVGATDAATADPGDTLYFRPAKSGETGATVVTSFASTSTANKFKFVGLDDTKTYTLVETATPSAEYTSSGDTTLEIAAGYKAGEGGAEVEQINKEVNDVSGNNATIVNYKGTTLPTTGGMGTMLFLGIGGAVAAGAGITLISKKRSKDEDEQ